MKGKARAKRNNDVYHAFEREKVRAKAEAALEAMSVEEKLLRPEGADAIVDDLVAENKTIFESLSNEKCSAYVFYSANVIKTESTGFASNRGDRNPIIKWSDESDHVIRRILTQATRSRLTCTAKWIVKASHSYY